MHGWVYGGGTNTGVITASSRIERLVATKPKNGNSQHTSVIGETYGGGKITAVMTASTRVVYLAAADQQVVCQHAN